MDQVYSFCKLIHKKCKKNHGVITLEQFSKMLKNVINFFKQQEKDIKMLIEFGDFIKEKYSITNCLISYNHIVFMLTYFKNKTIEDIPLTKYQNYFLNQETNILFTKYNDNYIAIGKLDNDNILPLCLSQIIICENNHWLWDFNSASETAKQTRVSPFVTIIK
jgi:hypothetical protein